MKIPNIRRVTGLVIALALVLSAASLCPAATTVQKNISEDSVWSEARSPYVVSDSVVLEEGATLKIEPGARVELAGEVTFEIRGKLIAIGTPDKPIVFTAHSDQPWEHISFTDFSADATYAENGAYLDGCILKNCVIEKSRGIFVRFGAPLITECEIRDNYSSGIRVEFGAPRITGNYITGNSTKYDPASGNGGGIIAYTDKNMLIADNIICNNISDGGRDGGGGIYAYAADDGSIIIIRNNIIFGNTSSRFGGGVYAYKSVLTRNTIIGNTATERGGGACAVESSLVENLIQSNTARRGGGIYAQDCEIVSNSVIRNAASGPEGGAINYFGSGNIRDNSIVSNRGAGKNACGGVYVSGNPVLRGNNLLNNSGYAIYVSNLMDAPEVSASDNYWGVTEGQAIQQIIYDWLDNETLGLASCMPALEEMSPNAPGPPPFNLTATTEPKGVRLAWDEAPGTRFDGHRVYFGTRSGYPHDRAIEAGSGTDFLLTGLEQGTEYWLAVAGYRRAEGGKEIESGFSEEIKFRFTGTAEPLRPPTIVSPPDNATGVSKAPAFEIKKPAAAAVTAARWQVSAFPDDFTALVVDAITSGERLWRFSPETDTLQRGCQYYWRVAFRTSDGNWSEWSKPAAFRTKQESPSVLFGPVIGKTTLEKTTSPYHAVGNIVVMPGAALEIEPGVELRIGPGRSILVRGTLAARGREKAPIVFTREGDENWGHVIFDDDSEDAIMEAGQYAGGCVLEQCLITHGGGIIVKSASPLIKDSEISHNKGSGVAVRQGAPLITGNDIHHNAALTNGGGLYAYTNDIIYVSSNRIHDNSANGDGGGVYAYGYMNNSTVHVENNEVFSNEAAGDGGGIFLSRSSAERNKIHSNRAAGDGGGVYATFGLVNANHIRNNHAENGGGIYAERNCSITRNYVASNTSLSGLGGGVYINFWGVSVDNEVFTKNTVTQNVAPSNEQNGGVFIVGYLVFENNNIFGNEGSQLYNGNDSKGVALLALDCYWGVDEKTKVSDEIVDGEDDPGLGKVKFEPFSPIPLKFD